MSSEKELLKYHVIQEIGNDFDDQLSIVSAEVSRVQGEVVGAGKVVSAIEVICQAVNKALDSNDLAKLLEKIKSAENPPVELAKALKEWLTKSIVAADGVRAKASTDLLIHQGRKDAMVRMIEALKKKADTTQLRYQKLQEKEAASAADPEGRRVPPTIKQQRSHDHEEGVTSNGTDTGS